MESLLVYAVAELLLSIHISLSNLLVLWVYIRKKHVRTVTNTYIFSLALTDFLVGSFGIPITVFSVMTNGPHSFYGCLLVHLMLCILCTVSTFHMLAIAIDKFSTICVKDRIFDSRHSRAVALISSCWIGGAGIALLPVYNAFGFAKTEEKFHRENDACNFTTVVDYRYLVYVIFFATILLPTALIVFCYVSIYRRIRAEEQQVKCLLRHEERQKRLQGRRKLIRILLILVISYGICWYPLYMINTIVYFFPGHPIVSLTLSAVVLSHISCALNPLIYAYGMPGYKKALREFFHLSSDCKTHLHGFTTTAAYGTNHYIHHHSDRIPSRIERIERTERKISAPARVQRSTKKKYLRSNTIENIIPV